MERHGNAPADNIPVVLAHEAQHGPVVHATNLTARRNGIHAGARVADMRAVCSELQVEHADIAGDRAALDRLVLWARRWCPWTVRDGDTGIILDTTGSDHLLGGEAAMLIEMETQLALLGLDVCLAVAPTWGAAWALARFGMVRAICGESETKHLLAPLPITGLRLDPATCLLLQRLGLKTIGALMEVPRLSLARRFVRAPLGANPLMRLDQALGKLAEPVASIEAKPRFQAHSRLAEPILDPVPHLPELCERLCEALAQAGMGCRSLYLTVFRTDGDVSRVNVSTSAPTRDPAHLRGLFQGKIERINPGFGFDLITLEAGGVEELRDQQARLDGQEPDDLELSRLLDRLCAKFGQNAVSRLALRESHIPERAAARVAASTEAPEARPVAAQPDRPIRLFTHPEEVRVLYAVPEGPPVQFIWRRQTCRVVRYAGPERIAPEWWKDRPGTRLRDYFKIENQNGQRLWLYREGLHGDGRGGDPRWFVHGCFL